MVSFIEINHIGVSKRKVLQVLERIYSLVMNTLNLIPLSTPLLGALLNNMQKRITYHMLCFKKNSDVLSRP